jgi:glycosyltransferase involved in cell wall biosynthesis
VAEQTPADIAQRLTWLFDHPDRAHEMGRRGAEKVESRFTWKKLAARTEDIYRSLRTRQGDMS